MRKEENERYERLEKKKKTARKKGKIERRM